MKLADRGGVNRVGGELPVLVIELLAVFLLFTLMFLLFESGDLFVLGADKPVLATVGLYPIYKVDRYGQHEYGDDDERQDRR